MPADDRTPTEPAEAYALARRGLPLPSATTSVLRAPWLPAPLRRRAVPVGARIVPLPALVEMPGLDEHQALAEPATSATDAETMDAELPQPRDALASPGDMHLRDAASEFLPLPSDARAAQPVPVQHATAAETAIAGSDASPPSMSPARTAAGEVAASVTAPARVTVPALPAHVRNREPTSPGAILSTDATAAATVSRGTLRADATVTIAASPQAAREPEDVRHVRGDVAGGAAPSRVQAPAPIVDTQVMGSSSSPRTAAARPPSTSASSSVPLPAPASASASAAWSSVSAKSLVTAPAAATMGLPSPPHLAAASPRADEPVLRAPRAPLAATELAALQAPLPPAPRQLRIDRVQVTVQAPATATSRSQPTTAMPAPTPRSAAPAAFRNPWSSYFSRRD
ncbi:MAG: hypothetical protein NW204_01750 [Xanthomonadaceae bacterium]|nr:hypothetical protein [Xanthomonadaceae bacterium]